MFRAGMLWLALICALSSGCVVVRPHERQNLARKSMTADRSASELRFKQHMYGAREGADGGTGEPGGGCGCN